MNTVSIVSIIALAGIGLVTVLELAGAGYDVVGSVRSAAKAELLQHAAADHGVSVRTIEMDVNDADSCKQGIEELAGMTDGGPWAVVNNAGYAQAGAVEDIDDELVRAQLETNLVAPMRIARLVLPRMRERGEGREPVPQPDLLAFRHRPAEVGDGDLEDPEPSARDLHGELRVHAEPLRAERGARRRLDVFGELIKGHPGADRAELRIPASGLAHGPHRRPLDRFAAPGASSGTNV